MPGGTKNPNPDYLKVNGWLLRGAVREDDLGDVFGVPRGPDPHDDPYGPLWRVMNHFFDPLNNTPLTLSAVQAAVFSKATGESVFHKAPDWALGTQDVFTDPTVIETGHRNHFTILDAREAEYRALTGHDGQGNPLTPAVNATLTTPHAIRNAYWATTFRALGDVLHVNQDMAQPQHTRNEPHSGVIGFGDKSVYEFYVDARATGARSFNIDGTKVTTLAPLTYTGYAIPTFSSYSDYWSTSPGPSSVSGMGLADYSNSGFFTPAHNMDDNTYSSPTTDITQYTPVQTTYPYGASSSVTVNFLTAAVNDELIGPSPPIRLTTQSVFNGIAMGGAGPVYSLNRFNYDDMASLLIPRAVAYSAGLLNYFFRGRMQISLPDDGVYGIVDHAKNPLPNGQNGQGFHKIKLKLQNVTAPISPPGGSPIGQDMSGGQLVAVVKYHLDHCYTPDLSGDNTINVPGVNTALGTCRDPQENIVTSTVVLDDTGLPATSVSLPAGAPPQTFTFVFDTPIPINVTDVYLQVVYRGPLGSENDAVAVATKDIPEPTFWTAHNVTDFLVCYNGTEYLKNPDGSYPASLLSQAGASYLDYLGGAASDYSVVQLAFAANSLSTPLVEEDQLHPGEYIRLAVLTDDREPYVWHIAQPGGGTSPSGFFSSAVNQLQYVFDSTTNSYASTYELTNTTEFRNTYADPYSTFYLENALISDSCPHTQPVNPPGYPTPMLAPVTQINGGFAYP